MPRLRERLLITCPSHTSIGRISSYVWTCTCNKIPNFAFFVLSMYLYIFVYWQVYLSCSWAWRVTVPQMVRVVKAPQRWRKFTWKVVVLGGLWRFLDMRVRSEDRQFGAALPTMELEEVQERNLTMSFIPPMWFVFFVTWKSDRWQPVSIGIFELSPCVWRSRLTAVIMETVWLCSGLFGSNVAGLFQHYFVLDLNVGVHRCL